MTDEMSEILDCPFCGSVPEVMGDETKVAVHNCKSNKGNLMVMSLDLWQRRTGKTSVDREVARAVAEEIARNYPLLEMLESAGMGRSDQGNTLWGMVCEICGKYKICSARIERIDNNISLINEIALELSVVNKTLHDVPGSISQKSVKKISGEIKRLTDALFDLISESRTG